MSDHYIDISTGSRYFYTSSLSPRGGANQLLNFKSIQHLYYSGFNTSSGYVEESSSYDNYFESSLATGSRTLPTSGEGIVFSIPQNKFGTHIEPNSVSIEDGVYTITDDGEGNLVNGSTKIGNIIYSHGQLIISDPYYYLHYSASQNPSISFKSNNIVQSYSYTVNISDYEFNHTLNPTAQKNSTIFYYSGSDGPSGSKYVRPSGIYADNVTGSEFQPYITTVGLYNDSNELLIVGKLAQPLPKPADTELTININLDV